MENNKKINEIYIDFYRFVDKIIYKIHNSEINKFLFYCEYLEIENGNLNYLPLTFCLGGGGYMSYSNIFKQFNLVNDSNLNTLDYDITFSIHKFIDKNNTKIFIKEIKKIINECLSDYNYKEYKSDIFNINVIENINRIWIKINCKIDNYEFHILELSFWLNGKISDNFSVNDFKFNKLYLYRYNDIYYYLLPLNLLIKTTFYAIADYFEMRNFKKCNKYIERVTFIKKINKKYLLLDNKPTEIDFILKNYKDKIKRKYKIINDYPYILSKYLVNIKNNGIIKCIYRNLRDNNHEKIKDLIDKYQEKCKNKKSYDPNLSEITLNDTIEL